MIKDRPKASGKQLKLVKDEDIQNVYRYSAYVTNMELTSAEIWRLYRQRGESENRRIGESENRIKELKYDFGFDSFNLKSFYVK